MLLDHRHLDGPETLSNRSPFRWWSDDRFTIGWVGHLYMPGLRAGGASIARLAKALRHDSLGALAPNLCGVFGLAVLDRRERRWQVAGDNAGLYRIFYDGHRVSTSFLDLVAARGVRRMDLDLGGITAFLAHGLVPAPRSYVTAIAKLCFDETLLLDADGVRVVAKRLGQVPEGEAGVAEFWADLATSLAGRRLSVDLTGGFDSRVVAATLSAHGLAFETAIATADRHSVEATLARQAADALGRDLQHCRHELAALEAELPLLYAATDAQHELRGAHRDWQNMRARVSRGLEIIAHGGGGEVFRDFNYVHEFPFWSARTPSFARYLDLRVAPVRMVNGTLTPLGRELAEAARADFIARCDGLRGRNNAESYDRVYTLLRVPEFFGRQFSGYINAGLDVVAPFLDYRMARAAWRMSPWRRWGHAWHRGMIARHAPRLSSLPTTDGGTAAAGPMALPATALNFAAQGVRRVSRKAVQRLFGRTLFEKRGIKDLAARDYAARLRAMPALRRGCTELAELGIVSSPDPDRLADPFVPRMLTLGHFLASVRQ